MRRINLANYTVPTLDEKGQPHAYQVRDSLVDVLFAPALHLNGSRLLDQFEFASKIKDCPGEEILLEEAEWQKLCEAVNAVEGMGQNEVELMRRVLRSPKVDVAVKGASSA